MLSLNKLLNKVQGSYNQKLQEISNQCRKKSQGSEEKYSLCKKKLQTQFIQYYSTGLNQAYLNEAKVNQCMKKTNFESQQCVKKLYQETKQSLKIFKNNLQNYNKFDGVF